MKTRIYATPAIKGFNKEYKLISVAYTTEMEH